MADSIYAPHNQEKLQATREAEQNSAATKSSHEDWSDAENGAALPPNPYITRSLLYISGIDPSMTDKELAGLVFEKVLPVRLKIDRNVPDGQTASGTVEFQTLEKAEKAYAIAHPPFELRIHQNVSDKEPAATAKPRLVKQLPHHTDNALVYDMFRMYGPLRKAQCILTNPSGVHTGFKGMASIQFYREEDAQLAQDEMHCAEVAGKSISVAIDTVARNVSTCGSEFRASAAPFVPGKGMSADAPSFDPTSRNVSTGSSASIYATASTAQNGTGSATNGAKPHLQYSNQAATYVDPCNLFIKNLDPEFDSNALFNSFRTFGHIVSARVMRDTEGKSREFGFVSFTTPAEAQSALQSMDNAKLGSKKITVRLHEPKTMRQEKLAARFGPANGDGSVSPAGDGSESNGSPSGTPTVAQGDFSKVDKRQSRSYFKAGVPANSNGLVDEEQLKSLSSVVRNELLSGEFSRKVQMLPSIKPQQVDDIVVELLKLRLPDAVEALNNPISLIQRVNEARDRLPQSPVQPVPASASTASEQLAVPMQQLSVSSASSAADNTSIMSAAPASAKERERLLKAVIAVLPPGAAVEDITDMIASLPKKDRALCLFNPEVLKQKVEEAKAILEITDESGEDAARLAIGPSVADKDGAMEKRTGGPNNSASETVAPTYTLSTLAALPAVEIIRLANVPSGASSAGLPLPKVDPEVAKSTDLFIDSLAGKALHDQKQKLGDQLFKKIRSFGVKGAPKITIHLLDTEDLRALAHLMNSYEAVLQEKVQQKVAAGLNK